LKQEVEANPPVVHEKKMLETRTPSEAKLQDTQEDEMQQDEMLKGLAEATRNLKCVMSGIGTLSTSSEYPLSLQSLEARIKNIEEKFVAVTNAFEKTFQMCEALEYNHSQKVAEVRTNMRQDLDTCIDDKLSCWMLELVDRDLLAPIQETLRKEDDLLNSVTELRIEGMLNMVADRVIDRIKSQDCSSPRPVINPMLPSQYVKILIRM
jgi:hypothetical protein